MDVQTGMKKTKTDGEQVDGDLYHEKLGLLNQKLDLLVVKEKLLEDKMEKCSKQKVNGKENGQDKGKKSSINHSQTYSSAVDHFICSGDAFSPTAMVRLEQNGIIYGPVRAFLDTGAQPNLVTFATIRNWKVEVLPTKYTVVGIDGEPFTIKQKVIFKVRPWYQSDVYLQETFWILPNESGWGPIMPTTPIDPNAFNNSTKLMIADPEFFIPKRVQVLLGVGFFARAVTSVIRRNVDGTALMAMSIGVIIFGHQKGPIEEESGKIMSAIKYTKEQQMDRLLERLWQQDQIGNCSRWTREEISVEDHFMRNHYRDNSGRFVVKLPLKDGITEIGSSRAIALRRFMYLEKKLGKDAEMKQWYTDQMNEMIQLGYIKLATKRPRIGEMVYHIPHHRVTKKPRIVYDASCGTDKGISLNDVQMLGPKLQRDMHEIVSRFRRHRIGFCADIKKMYNQVRINEEQWNLLRLFWREEPNQKLSEYYFTVVPFGLTASGYLAVRSMIQAAREAKNRAPKAAEIIENDFYMDDCVSGTDSIEAAVELGKGVDMVLKGAGFQLCKWKSNAPGVLDQLGEQMENNEIVFSEADGTTILGLKWLIVEDKFTYQVKAPVYNDRITKRKVVSWIAQIYDPVGYVSPVVVIGKVLIQDLWRVKLEWDDELPNDLLERWKEVWEDLPNLERFRIDRWLGTGPNMKIQIHGFADSSTTAMGAQLYVRAVHPDGRITSNLVTSKTKVAPLKTVTVPRLELSAAETLARLFREVSQSMEWGDVEYTLWTDSSISLHWIRKEPCEMRIYVANRVASIQQKTDVRRWRHVDTRSNPADLASRGLSAAKLVNNEFWLHGPSWLRLPESQWPVSKFTVKETSDTLKEWKVHSVTQWKKVISIRAEKTEELIPITEYAAKLEKVLNIISYANRFMANLPNREKWKTESKKSKRGKVQVKFSPPSNEEKATAMMYLLRRAQESHYGKEINALRSKQVLPENSRILPLNPILDGDGIVRVGGRLNRSELDYEAKHPAIIPNGSDLARMFLDYAHRMTMHGGVQVSTHFIRRSYWIPKLRSELRRCISKCIVCVRLNARNQTQLMAELPADRIQSGKAFLHTGVDYAGHFYYRLVDRNGQELATQKYWIVVFVCLKTRAITLDMVADQSSVAFIRCYERFIARRGRCQRLYSDNGKTFIGAEKSIKLAMDKWITQSTLDHVHQKGTEWIFMSPAAPHQGGLYEAAVKSMKHHLKRSVGLHTLDQDQLATLLAQIEAVLNSRPIHPLSDDCDDLQALTPGHFLVGESLIVPTAFEVEAEPKAIGIVKAFRLRQKIVQNFWDRWRLDYLHTLQERKKWRKEKENLTIGTMVLLMEERTPPAAWSIGRIVAIKPGKDGLVRTVDIRTGTGTYTRPVQKVCILPVEAEKLEV